MVITTRNRKDELRVAVQSALEQRDVSIEVLVIDDGSTDGTSELIAREFPQVKLHRSEKSLGLIVQRTRSASLATGSILISIDDDAAFSSPRCVAQTLAEFDHPRIGAVAIPYINIRQDNIVHQRAPQQGEKGAWVTWAYRGTAYALQRELFLDLGGYEPVLFHQEEEGDLCLRMLDRGYVVRLGNADPIHHFVSPSRDHERMFVYAARNQILLGWQNVPMPYLLPQLGGTTFLQLSNALRNSGHPIWTSKGLLRGYGMILRRLGARRPVSRGAYRLYRQLRRGSMPLAEIEALLPALTPIGSSAGNATPAPAQAS